MRQSRCGCWQTTEPTHWPWFYPPTLYWYGWRTLRLFWLGDDEWCRRTLVLGWNITGQIVIPLRECRGCEGCGAHVVDGIWRRPDWPRLSAEDPTKEDS